MLPYGLSEISRSNMERRTLTIGNPCFPKSWQPAEFVQALAPEPKRIRLSMHESFSSFGMACQTLYPDVIDNVLTRV